MFGLKKYTKISIITGLITGFTALAAYFVFKILAISMENDETVFIKLSNLCEWIIGCGAILMITGLGTGVIYLCIRSETDDEDEYDDYDYEGEYDDYEDCEEYIRENGEAFEDPPKIKEYEQENTETA